MMNTLQKMPKMMATTSIHALNKGAKKTKDTCTKVTSSISRHALQGARKTKDTCTKMTNSITVQAVQGVKKTKDSCVKMTKSISHQTLQINRQMISALIPKRKVGALPNSEDGGHDLRKTSQEVVEESAPLVMRDPLFVAYIKDVLAENEDVDNLPVKMQTFFEEKHNLLVVEKCPATGVIVTIEALEMLYGHVLLLEGRLAEEIVKLAREAFDVYVCVRFTLFCSGPVITTLTPKEIAVMLRWFTAYRADWDEQYANTAFPEERVTWMEDLKSEYLRRGVHDQVRAMIDNRLQLLEQDEIIENEDLTLSTSIKYDVTLIVESQLSVARESLPPSILHAVLSACNEELLNLAGGLMFEIESKWKTMSVERLCSSVNDAQSLLDQFEQRNDDLNDSVENDEIIDDLLKECSLLSLHAAGFLCERIFLDVRENVLDTVGTTEWINGTVIETVVTTLRDYFDDIKQWIPADYFFPKILKTCIDLILRIYVESFFSNTLANGLTDRSKAVDVLQSDWERLWKFFGTENKVYHGCAGFYDKEKLWHRLHILEVMGTLLTTTSEPKKLQDHIQVMLSQLGTDSGSASILHLFGLQKRRISAWETQQWHETIAMALEHARMQCSGSILYQIPDLRNSKFVKRMGRSRRNTSLVDVSHTNQLVRKRRVPNKLITQSRKLLGADRILLNSWRLEEEV
jgi:hypothetical protein